MPSLPDMRTALRPKKNRKQTGQTGNLSSGFRLIPGYRIRLPGEFTAPARRFVQIEPC